LRLHSSFLPLLRALAVSCLLASVIISFTQAQQAPQKPAEKPGAKASTLIEPQNPAQIELLETKIRFEADGSSRKEVHARVHINSELGVRQFARLNFDYNRSFESIDIPLVRITHPSGGTADILPSAITDNPNPVVVNAPAYQNVRVKSVRILGLAPGDTLEYRVITTVSLHPLAPDFWLDHSFDRTGVVSQEIFELDLPAPLFEEKPPPSGPPLPANSAPIAPPDISVLGKPIPPSGQIYISPMAPESSKNRIEENGSFRLVYRWELPLASRKKHESEPPPREHQPDVVVTTFASWYGLAEKLKHLWYPYGRPSGGAEITSKYREIVSGDNSNRNESEVLYEYVSQKIKTLDLPFGFTGFRVREPREILSSGYATSEEKAVLFLALLPNKLPFCDFLLIGPAELSAHELVRPSVFSQVLIALQGERKVFYLDPSLEVAPFGVIPADIRGRNGLLLNHPGFGSASTAEPVIWKRSGSDLPFPSSQKVHVDAVLAADGKLTAKVHYSMRGDNELLLRVAFHQAPKEKWKDLAQLLSLSDGFRGKVTSVTASDPSATREPFTLDYESTMPKFVDWSKKPVRIPALLPQIGLPDSPAKPAAGAATSPIELGTPLEVETHMTLHLPPGTTTQTPTGTSVQRDYATFSSQYSAKGPTITASRHINFLLREVPADRAADYNAFLRAVQSDEAQDFTLDRASTPAPASKPLATAPSIPNRLLKKSALSF
jgi:hypothetical protein